MFPNQVNFRELFSNPGAYLSSTTTTGGRPDQYDSQRDSQLPCSQVDFPDSQDSQASHSNSPGKKFYSRYNNKPGFSRQNSQENLRNQLTSVKLTNQQLQSNIARAKDRDERDLLNTMLSTIRESSAEVLMAIAVVRDNVQQGGRSSQGLTENYFEKMHRLLTNNHDEMMKALKVNDKHREDQARLREQILKKEAHITELEAEVSSLRSERNEDLIAQLTGVCEAQHRATQARITELCAVQQRDLRGYSDQQRDVQRTGLHTAAEHLKLVQKAQQDGWKDNANKLGQKIQQITQQCKTSNEKLVKDMKEAFRNTQKQFKIDLEKTIEKQMKGVHPSKKTVDSTDLYNQKEQMYQLLEDYKMDLSLRMNEQLETLLQRQESTLKDLLQESLDEEKENAQSRYEVLAENVQTRIEEEIRDLKDCHKDQLDRIMENLKLLAPPTTPKIPKAIIPPPTPEQFKEQKSPTVPAGRTLRSRTVTVASVETKSTKSSPDIFGSMALVPASTVDNEEQTSAAVASCRGSRNMKRSLEGVVGSRSESFMDVNSSRNGTTRSAAPRDHRSYPHSDVRAPVQQQQHYQPSNVAPEPLYAEDATYNTTESINGYKSYHVSSRDADVMPEPEQNYCEQNQAPPKAKPRKRAKRRSFYSKKKPKSKRKPQPTAPIIEEPEEESESQWEPPIHSNEQRNAKGTPIIEEIDEDEEISFNWEPPSRQYQHEQRSTTYGRNHIDELNKENNFSTSNRSGTSMKTGQQCGVFQPASSSFATRSYAQTSSYDPPKYVSSKAQYTRPWMTSKRNYMSQKLDQYDFDDKNQSPNLGLKWNKQRSYDSRQIQHQQTAKKQKSNDLWQNAIQYKPNYSRQSNNHDYGVVPYVQQRNSDYSSSDGSQPEEDDQGYSATPHSRESSPSLSVTEVFIRRKIRHETKTPELNKWAVNDAEGGQSERDSVATPYLTERDYHNTVLDSGGPARNNQGKMKKRNFAPANQTEPTNFVTTEVMAVKRSFHKKNRKN